MPIKDIRDKYGKGKGREVVNRAIRAELIGGNECLDAIGLVHQLNHKLRHRNLPGAGDAQAALDSLRRVAELMSDEIAARYDLRGSLPNQAME